MPLYEYQCQKCQTVFELIQKFSDEPLTVHDNCGGAVERLISAPALQFKGSGWYVNDYAKSGSSAGGKSGAKSGGGDADSSGGSGAKSASDGSSSASSDSSSSSSSSSSSGDSGSSKSSGGDTGKS